MNDRPKLFKEFYEPHSFLQNDHTKIHVIIFLELD